MAHEMADTAAGVLSQLFPPRHTPIDINRVKESPKKAIGTGSGIV